MSTNIVSLQKQLEQVNKEMDSLSKDYTEVGGSR